ncbi:hypothetical protein DFR47_11146 [Pseudochrobactrum asaccharolyticum]|uniref:Uncharacterized protein n=1 Tax=Pseudochrobactrum asaccharolyticum TaxID=354351 RepID=A0A366DLL6_9HYPH|nr:hypothetical protein DFR47_11146 [Pseudochrobactrum asaccharolyticum]
MNLIGDSVKDTSFEIPLIVCSARVQAVVGLSVKP